MAYGSKIWDGIQQTYGLGRTALNGLGSTVGEAYGHFQKVPLYGGTFTPRNELCDETCETIYHRLPVDAQEDLVKGEILAVRGAVKVLKIVGSDPCIGITAVGLTFIPAVMAVVGIHDRFSPGADMTFGYGIPPIVATAVIGIPMAVGLFKGVNSIKDSLENRQNLLNEELYRLRQV